MKIIEVAEVVKVVDLASVIKLIEIKVITGKVFVVELWV